jgi:hypothetical protein
MSLSILTDFLKVIFRFFVLYKKASTNLLKNHSFKFGLKKLNFLENQRTLNIHELMKPKLNPLKLIDGHNKM